MTLERFESQIWGAEKLSLKWGWRGGKWECEPSKERKWKWQAKQKAEKTYRMAQKKNHWKVKGNISTWKDQGKGRALKELLRLEVYGSEASSWWRGWKRKMGQIQIRRNTHTHTCTNRQAESSTFKKCPWWFISMRGHWN